MSGEVVIIVKEAVGTHLHFLIVNVKNVGIFYKVQELDNMPISQLELKHFLSAAFVECGTATGDGVLAALQVGFANIYSIEINPECYRHCVDKYSGNRNVHLTHGNCGDWLDIILNKINKQCTIYLDANGWAEEKESPFHVSIEAILRHERNDHIILVDDINHGHLTRKGVIDGLRGQIKEGPKECIIQQVMRINPKYNFSIIDTHSVDFIHKYDSWILVAHPNKISVGDSI